MPDEALKIIHTAYFREDLPRLFSLAGLCSAVEVGVWMGGYTKWMVRDMLGPIYLVDPYKIYDLDEYEDNNTMASAEQMDIAAAAVSGELARHINHSCDIIAIRKESVATAEDFGDHSIDFVYIDANHKYDYVLQDFESWYPKVKPGGVIGGHDFHRPPVFDAVALFMKSHGIEEPYVTGEHNELSVFIVKDNKRFDNKSPVNLLRLDGKKTVLCIEKELGLQRQALD